MAAVRLRFRTTSSICSIFEKVVKTLPVTFEGKILFIANLSLFDTEEGVIRVLGGKYTLFVQLMIKRVNEFYQSMKVHNTMTT